MRPTSEIHSELQIAFDYFNAQLFDGKLPPCLLTLQRKKRTYGYFCPDRFVSKKDGHVTDEIAMNPTYFGVVNTNETMETLVHEMVHMWQSHFGKSGRRKYHNKEWGDKMEQLGLMPSSTGKPGGKRTGDRVHHYPIENSAFVRACKNLLSKNFRITWADRFPAVSKEEAEGLEGVMIEIQPPPKATRTKYTCPTCTTNVWGKPALNLVCGDCGKTYRAEDPRN